jgi:hypothetical protein
MLKHVGRIKKTQKKCIVAYRVVPGTNDECVIVPTESLSADEHDSLIKLVESSAGQEAYELAEAMARTSLPDGRNMLAGFHTTNRMVKTKTTAVEMTPDTKSVVGLDELNNVIAQQKGVTVADLAIKDPNAPAKPAQATAEPKTVDPIAAYTDTPAPVAEPTAPVADAESGVITDEALAASYRSQADRLFKEAKALREQAEALVPTKKKTTAKAKQEVASA